jgi:hypothetical protein
MRDSAETIRNKVYSFFVQRGARGATDEEVQHALDIRAQTQIPRRRELELKGKIADSGHRRRNASGILAVVWALADLPEMFRGPNKSIKEQLREAIQEIAELKKENSYLKERLEHMIKGEKPKIGDRVIMTQNTNGNPIHEKNRVHGEVVAVSKKGGIEYMRVKIKAPWGTTSNWYESYQLEKEK